MATSIARYIWQRDNWPEMVWSQSALLHPLAEVNLLRGKLLGRIFGIITETLR